jgi:hypothetical protein
MIGQNECSGKTRHLEIQKAAPWPLFEVRMRARETLSKLLLGYQNIRRRSKK